MKEGISELLRRLNLEYNGELIRTDVDEYVSKIIKMASIITISRNEQILGFIAYYDNDLKKESAFLTMLAVDLSCRELGYGKRLLEMSIANLRQSGFKTFTLEVLQTNEGAVRLYTAKGFKTTEIKGAYYHMEMKL